MQAFKTKALVQAKDQLNLIDLDLSLELGNVVEVIILYKNSEIARSNWQDLLKSIGTYSEDELAGFAEVRKEFDQWQRPNFS